MDQIGPEVFKYLETECGYKRTFTDPTQLRFESATNCIDIFVDPRAYEVGLLFGRTDDPQRAYRLEELADVFPSVPRVRGWGKVRTAADLATFLERVAVEARPVLCALPVLPEAVYEQMDAARREHAARREALGARAREVKAARARRRAQQDH